MIVATLLVILMSIPGLALFYGGLVRSKNMLSLLMQVFMIFWLIIVLWVVYGYSFAFTEGNAYSAASTGCSWSGIFASSTASARSPPPRRSQGVVIPEYLFVVFQATFAAITVALIVGAFAERAKFSAVLVFAMLWFTFAYLPIAHMVWFWPGPDGSRMRRRWRRNPPRAVGCGRRAPSTSRAAPSCTSTPVLPAWWALRDGQAYRLRQGIDGAAQPDVHDDRRLAAVGGLVRVQRRIGARSRRYCRAGVHQHAGRHRRSRAVVDVRRVDDQGQALDARRRVGCCRGLVAITPACGFVGVSGALVLGLLAGFVCLWGVNGLKRMLGADDALDVFGVHGIGGILGAMLTGVFAAPSLGGQGIYDYVANKISPDYYMWAS